MSHLKLCYNKGCGKTFDPKNNPEDGCLYHPGKPYFHDAYKSWSCCKKRTISFSEFLNIAGCTRGQHSPEKRDAVESSIPPASSSPAKSPETAVHQEIRRPLTLSLRREDYKNAPFILFKVKISPEVKNEAETVKQKLMQETKIIEDIAEGTMCQNKGCKQFYEKGKDVGECMHHPGYPVFHEGLKYWSCCKKYFTDFDKFLDQAGCTAGEHEWVKQVTPGECRFDWYQTPHEVVLIVYGKNFDPDNCHVELTPFIINISLGFIGSHARYENTISLFDAVNIQDSSIHLTLSKVEIKLKKEVDLMYWQKLEYISPEK